MKLREAISNKQWKNCNYMFGYSSQDVFSTVAYFLGKLVTEGINTTELAFVFGEARIDTMKCLAIPKLELQAPLLAFRLRQEVKCAI